MGEHKLLLEHAHDPSYGTLDGYLAKPSTATSPKAAIRV